MYDRLVAAFADGGAEAEALNLAASLPRAHIAFLAASAHMEAAKPDRALPRTVAKQGRTCPQSPASSPPISLRCGR